MDFLSHPASPTTMLPHTMEPQEIINKHFAHLERLVEMEEAEEVNQFQLEFVDKTPEQRELTGQALLRLRIQEFHFSPAGHRLISFRYFDGRPLPLYSPDPGDVLTLASDPLSLFDLPIGTVYEKTRDTITVAFNRALPDWVQEDGLYYLNIAGARSSYKKMFEAINRVRNADHTRLAFLRDLSLGIKKPESFDPIKMEDIPFYNPNLNPWQKEAVRMAIASRDVALVHGPPGTGKTTALIEIIRQSVREGEFVFATAPSNTACDHLLECLVACGVPALRLGHPARIMEHLRKHTLDFKLAHHPLAKAVDELESELDRLFTQRDRKKNRGRGLSWDSKVEIADVARSIKVEIQNLDSQIFSQVVSNAPVMVGTLASSNDPILKKKIFDLLVIDEASQSTEPSSWIPIIKSEKVIFAGDHFQLPPTVLSKKAEEKGLGKTLFERLHQQVGDEWKTLLRVQYRMNEKIMAFSSKEFYGGELIADESVKKHTLADLPHVKDSDFTREVFLFLDTAGRGFEEKLEPGSESRYNPDEADLVVNHLTRLLEHGVKPEEIAIISPYSAQVRLLASRMPDPFIEVDSVDGFQGREKEVVILSLVRANVEGELGFLADTRRMNVAMTRARRKLLVIGDSATIGNIPFYRDFLQYAESINAYRSSWDESA
jgi:ATP-dependent RNA/DNA helicase IGHMBP2